MRMRFAGLATVPSSPKYNRLHTRMISESDVVSPIADKTADCHGRAQGVNRWHGMAGCQRDDLIGICKKRNGAAHHERVSPLLNKLRKGRLELAWATCVHEHEANCTSTRGSLQLFPFALGKNGVGRVAQVSDRVGRRHQFEQ